VENFQDTGSRHSIAEDSQDNGSPHRDVDSLMAADMSDGLGNWWLYLQGGYVIVPEGEQVERLAAEQTEEKQAERGNKETNLLEEKQTEGETKETELLEEKQTEGETKETEPSEEKPTEGENKNKETEPSEEKPTEIENKEAEPPEEKPTEKENKEANPSQEKQEKPEESQKINYVKNLSELRQREQAVSDLCYNSFLLHGFHQYRYLILTNEFIGVPDHFSEREAVAAKMMGFPYFMEAENIEACSLGGEVRSEPPKTGSFGYFLRKI
jgi:hypothetical protein